ncbi:hypothetical protein GCM10023079_28810 [Streptomyces chitinivorans]
MASDRWEEVTMHRGSLVRLTTDMYRLTCGERRGGRFDCQSISQDMFPLVKGAAEGIPLPVQQV